MKTSRDDRKPKRRADQPGSLVGVRIQPDLLTCLDDWRRKQPDLPNRPEAIRQLIEAGLAARHSNTRPQHKVAPSHSLAAETSRASPVDGADPAKLSATIDKQRKEIRTLKAVMKGMVDRKFLRDKEKLLADLSAADFKKIAKSLHPDTAGLVTAEERNEATAIFLRLQRLF